MPQTTVAQVLTRTWTQLSTGAETYTLTVEDGTVILADSTAAPAANASGHVVNIGDLAWVVTPPSILWARAAGPSASIILSGG